MINPIQVLFEAIKEIEADALDPQTPCEHSVLFRMNKKFLKCGMCEKVFQFAPSEVQ